MRNAIVFGLATSFVLALFACGGAATPATSPSERPGRVESNAEPSSVEEAAQQIKEAQAALEGRASPDMAPPASAGTSSTTKGTEPDSGEPSSGRCVSSCRAIASMRRAVTALCRMAGPDDARCTDAKKTLESSESRIATCHC